MRSLVFWDHVVDTFGILGLAHSLDSDFGCRTETNRNIVQAMSLVGVPGAGTKRKPGSRTGNEPPVCKFPK